MITDAEKLAHHERLKTRFDELMYNRIAFVVEEAINNEITELVHPLCSMWSRLDVNRRARLRSFRRARSTRVF